MKKNFEERLLDLSGPEELKAAKQLLKTGRLTGAWRTADGWLAGRFRENGGAVDTRVRPDDYPKSVCACRREGAKLCEHELALIMYAGRFHGTATQPAAEEKSSYYAGLRQESFPELVRRVRPPQAQLFIDAVSAFPHVPSKWENAKLAVKLRTPDREYLGNLNNLRQLYFDKALTVTLKLEHFSLHEQQIIRFLAINGEAESSQILLNAEMTAEFFHCLVNFPRFTRDGRPLQVRGDFAEAVLLKKKEKGGDCRLSPGIRVNGAVLPTAGAKVITGRAGCWIGRDGEYFFVPGICEISYLRNFFRTAVQPPPAGETVDEFLRNFPLPVVPADSFEPEIREAGVLLEGCPVDAEHFVLSLQYLYAAGPGQSLRAAGSGTLVRDGERFWRRDEAHECEFENDLALFGFDLSNPAAPTLTGADRIGTFLDAALPELLRSHPRLALGRELAGLSAAGKGLPELAFRARLLRVADGGCHIEYTLETPSGPVDWDSAARAAAAGTPYLPLPGGMVRIGSRLGDFINAAPRFMRNLDAAARSFFVPFFAAGYYTALAREVPGAMVAELAAGPEATALPPDPSRLSPFTGTLRTYQAEGVRYLQWMTDREFNVILADEMGLGKTVQLLALLASRKEREHEPALIVCPASLVTNWERECRRFVPGFRVAAPPDGGERADILAKAEEFDLVILSYAAARLSAELLKHRKWSYLILDEAQHIKNPGSSNAKNCKNINARHRLVLTGTPLENTPEDLWSILDFLQPGMLGTLASFRKTYADLRENPRLREDLAARIAPFIKRRTKAQVAQDLPPKSELSLYCDLEPAQRELYEKIRAEGLRQLATCREGDTRANAAIFTTLLRLRQLCCHPALLPESKGTGVPSAKTELLMELLHENLDSNHKILLFSQFTSLLACLIPELEKAGIPFEYLDGTTRNRQQRVDRFNQTPEIPLFLLSLKAGGTGLNLTSADTVIIYDPWWNPAVELQAADRTHRIGQTRPVSSLKLVVRNSIEEKILELQSEKRELFDSVVEGSAAGNFSIEELRFLLEG